jgi:hypothetical protein
MIIVADKAKDHQHHYHRNEYEDEEAAAVDDYRDSVGRDANSVKFHTVARQTV